LDTTGNKRRILKQKKTKRQVNGNRSASANTQNRETSRQKAKISWCFFWIEGAFDNTPFNVIYRALTERNVEISLREWIRFMLSSRSIQAEMHGDQSMVVAARGCSHGRVLSPMLWSLVVDELLWNLNDAGLYAQQTT